MNTRRNFLKALGAIPLMGWLPTPSPAPTNAPVAVLEDSGRILFDEAKWPGLEKWYKENFREYN